MRCVGRTGGGGGRAKVSESFHLPFADVDYLSEFSKGKRISKGEEERGGEGRGEREEKREGGKRGKEWRGIKKR